MINRQDSRHRIKRTNLTGVVPTAHTASTDFTDGTWLNTDLREAEFFYNIPDKKLWIGTGTSSIEIAQIGSTTSGNSLEQTLSIGNNSGTNNIIMGTATSIKSANFGGQIDLGFMSSFLVLSTDNGTLDESYIFLGTNSWYTGGKTSYLQGIAGNLYLATDGLNNISGNRVSIGGNGTVSISSSTGDIKLVTDTGKSVEISTGTSIKSENGGAAISLDTYGLAKNIFISNDGVGMESSIEMTPSSFSINNSTGNLTLSSSTYSISMLSNVEMSVGKLIKSASGGSQIDLNPGGDNWISLTTDSGAYSTSYIDMASTYVDISTNNGACEIYLDGTETTISGDDVVVRSGSSFVTSIPGSIQLESGTYSTYVQSLQFRKASKSQSTATSSTIASIPMVDGETITIEAKVNAVCTYPNRNYGARLMAVFLKYGGTIYQTGTTDIVAKDGFGDGTTTTIDTDGTNVRIRVTNGSGVTTRWVTTYDYLQSS